MEPKVGIVILTRNRYQDTKECLESVSRLSYSSYEVVVVDNASTDDSCQRLSQEFPSVDFILAHENIGFARGNNLGIEYFLRKGTDHIFLLNDDVVLPPGCLELLVESFEQNPGTGIVGGKIYYHDPPDRIWAAGGRIYWLRGGVRGIGFKETDSGLYDTSRSVDYIPGAAVMIARKVFETIGLLPGCYFIGGEEADFAVRAKRAGFGVLYVPDSYCSHKVGYSSRVEAPMAYNRFRNRFLFLERNLPRPLWWLWQLASWTYVTLFWDAWAYIRKRERRRTHRVLYKLAMRDHRKYNMVAAEHLNAVRILFSDTDASYTDGMIKS